MGKARNYFLRKHILGGFEGKTKPESKPSGKTQVRAHPQRGREEGGEEEREREREKLWQRKRVNLQLRSAYWMVASNAH